MKPILHYSGPRSREFWRRVNSLKGEKHNATYLLGCILQDIEAKVLRYLTEKRRKL